MKLCIKNITHNRFKNSFIPPVHERLTIKNMVKQIHTEFIRRSSRLRELPVAWLSNSSRLRENGSTAFAIEKTTIYTITASSNLQNVFIVKNSF